MRLPSICLIAPVLALTLVTVCSADLITITFEGQLNDIDTQLESWFSTGDLMRVSIVYESPWPDARDADPAEGRYDCIQSLDISVAGYAASATGGYWRVSNDYGPPVLDPVDQVYTGAYAPITSTGGTLSGADLGDMPLWMFVLDQRDDTATALSSDALPVSFTPEDFGTRQMRLYWRDVSDYGIYNRSIAAWGFTCTSCTVPVPSAVLLGVLGLAAAGRRLRRR